MWDNGTNWGYWRMEQTKDGKLTKVPKNPNTGNNADTSDLSTWSDFGTASIANMNDPVDPKMGGMAFVLVDNMAGIDVDAHGVDKNPLQDEILALFDGTYMEQSPSGKGIHILFRVDKSRLPILENGKWDGAHYYQKNPHIDVESYVAGTTKRYLTFTGTMVSSSMDMLDMTDQFLTFIDKYQKKSIYQKHAPVADTTQQSIELDMSIEQILDRARQASNGADFIALYDNGDLSRHNNDHSAADQALCNYLAWYLGKDVDKIDAAFRNSALYRQKWEREDYRMSTIENAINGTRGQYNPFGGGVGVITPPVAKNPSESLSEAQEGNQGKPQFDLEALKWYLDEHGIRIMFNDITQQPSVRGFGSNYGTDNAIKALPSHIYGDLKCMYKGVTLNIIREFIEVIAMDRMNHYNPVLDYFKTKHYDGGEHLAQVYQALHIEGDALSQLLVRKWFMQGWALLYNDPDRPYGADGVLTLAGPQGIGKTTFFRKVAVLPEFFRAGQSISSRDKDNERRVVTTWIAELGEIGCTFKSDMDKVKQFITNERDEYRLSYARYDTSAPRRTNMGATVNGDEYLIDNTGNRRFWTVPLTDIDLDLLDSIDFTQVWLEVYENYVKGQDIQKFRLDKDERAMLDNLNKGCEKSMDGEDEVREVIRRAKDAGAQDRETTVAAWIEHNVALSEMRMTARKCGPILNKLGYPETRRDKHGRYRMLPWI
jgi:hypothetical protein